MSIQSGQTIDRDTLNRAYVSKSATGTQIMAGSLRLLGGIVIDGAFAAGATTVGTLTAGATSVTTLTITGAVNLGANTITTTGRITAGSFAGDGSLLTSLNGTNIGTGTVNDLRLSANVVLLNKAQTFTANNTYSAAANLYFAGGTTYYINTVGSAYFNALQVAGNVTLDGNDYLTFGSVGIGAPSDTSAGAKIKLFGNSYQIGIEGNAIWYDSAYNHKFYSNSGTATRTLRAEITEFDTHIFTDLNVDKNLEVLGELKAGVNNEFPDPLLASENTSIWGYSSNGTMVFDATQAPVNTGAIGSIKITATAADSFAYTTTFFDVNPNEWITYSAYNFATTSGKSGDLYIQWLTAAKAHISYSGNTFVASTSWERVRLTAQAPATARYFKIRIGNQGGAAAVMYFSGFQIERGRTMTGFKPYQGGRELSIAHNGAESLIYSLYPARINKALTVQDTLSITGTSTTLNMIHTADGGESVINLMGNGQGTGRLFVGQSATHGGGIEYNGDGAPGSSGSGGDFVTLYRVSASVYSWTARNFHDSNDWEFRGKVTTGAGLAVTGVASITSNATVGGTLAVTGAITAPSLSLTTDISFADVSGYWLKVAANWGIYWDTATNMVHYHGAGISRFSVDLDTGDTLIGGTFNAAGATTFSSTLGVTGAATLSSTLAVIGNTTISTMTASGMITAGNISVPVGTVNIAGSTLSGSTIGYLTITGTGGYIQVGPQNASYAHIYTDRPTFYFNKALLVNGNQVLTTADEGSGNGIDADTVDGVHKTALMSSAVAREKYIVPPGGLASSVSITIPNAKTYVLATNRLQVFRDGWLQDLIDDYLEVTTSTINFTYDLPEGTKITFIINGTG